MVFVKKTLCLFIAVFDYRGVISRKVIREKSKCGPFERRRIVNLRGEN